MGKIYYRDVGCADCTIIHANDGSVFLIDCHDIESQKQLLPSSKKVRGVFITHQHADHFSGLSFLRNNGYRIDELIYSPYNRRHNDSSVTIDEWNEFKGHRDYFERKGTNCTAPYRQSSCDKPFWKTNGLQFEIIGPAKSVATSATRELHDACLVVKAKCGKSNVLFAGDASDDNLNYIAKNASNFCNGILHASHHGSINGADLEFIKKCNATDTIISTKSGVYSNVPHATALRRYKENTKNKVFRTDVDGNITTTF